MFYRNVSTDLSQQYVINSYLSANNQGVAMLRINSKDRKSLFFVVLAELAHKTISLNAKLLFDINYRYTSAFFKSLRFIVGSAIFYIARITIAVFPRNG